MESIDINQALPQMIKLLEMASTGEEIIITKNNQPMVKLVSVQHTVNPEWLTLPNKNQSLQDLIEQSAEKDQQLTPQERTEKWLAFVETLPQQSANLPNEALHRDTMYD